MENLLDTLKIELHTAKHSICGKWWRFELCDPFTRIYYIDSGEGLMFVNGKKVRLLKGHLYIVPAFSRLKTAGKEDFGQHWIHFSAKIYSTVELFKIIDPVLDVKLENPGEIEERVKRLLKISKNNDLKSRFESDVLVRYLLSFFIPKHVPAGHGKRIEKLVKFTAVLEFIEKNIMRQMSLEELSSRAGLNPVYFSNSFSETFGLSPVKYVNSQRIEKAKIYLASSDKRLEEIADATGFTDAFYFSKIFKKYTGNSPSEYRKKVRYEII
ncbi:MAG: hypothetical protein A2231_02700 [Candidatus Firestonebacteria bacterium RIFOXYA2_FULL_40_8]|nr:MAG: hypothetical protein A2231_02700 [Candidatus Firestonebacteria bacterium RIFOXYA2_FULL_40_8]